MCHICVPKVNEILLKRHSNDTCKVSADIRKKMQSKYGHQSRDETFSLLLIDFNCFVFRLMMKSVQSIQ